MESAFVLTRHDWRGTGAHEVARRDELRQAAMPAVVGCEHFAS
jgi:hypothetical protein